MKVGQVLRKIREESDISQVDLAKHLKITSQALSQYELGKRVPDIEMVNKIADFFDVSVDYLLGRTDVKNPSTPYKIDGNKTEEDLLQVTEPEFIRYSNSSYNNLKKLINTRKDLSPEQLDAINTLIDEQFDSLDKFIRAMIKSK